MSLIFSTNNRPTSAGGALFLLKECLKTAGWTVRFSGDGTSNPIASGTDLLTLSVCENAPSGGYINLCLKAPTGTKEIYFYRAGGSSYDRNFVMMVSPAGGFSLTGSGNNYTYGAAPDTKTVFGIGDGNYLALFPNAGTEFNWHIAADNAGEYGFYAFGQPVGGGDAFVAVVMDGVQIPADGDTDPVVYHTVSEVPSTVLKYQDIAGPSATKGPYAWMHYAASDKEWNQTPAGLYKYSGGIVVPGGLPASVFTSKDGAFPVAYMRAANGSNPNGLKGISKLLMWAGTNRSTGDTLSIASAAARDRIVVGHVSLPWDGSTPSV